MSMLLNAASYMMADKLTNKDSYQDLSGTLSNLVSGSFRGGSDEVIEDLRDQNDFHSDILSDIRDDGRFHNDNLIQSFRDDFSNYSEETSEAQHSLLTGMRMSTFKVELINAELDIVDPMQLAFREMFLGLREDNLMFQHENSQWFEKIVQGLDRLDRSGERNAIGIVLAYKQFMRHPVWYTLSAVANLVVDLGKMVASSGFKLLFGFGKKKTVDEQILEETKRQTEFMLTGEIDQTKSTWEQFKSGGVAGLIGRSIGEDLGITQSEAQKRADARLQGEEVAGGIAGFLSDKIFGREIVRRERLEQQKDEPSPCCLNTNRLLEDMSSVIEISDYKEIKALERIGDGNLRLLEDMSSVAKISHDKEIKALEHIGDGNLRLENLAEQKDESVPLLSKITRFLKRMFSRRRNEHEDAMEFLASIGDNTKDTAKESKKTNRHLMMSKMMSILSSVGSFFKGFGGVGGILTKGIGAGIIAKMLYSSWDKLKSGEGIGITNTLSSVIGGLMVGGIKGAAVGGAFAVGIEIGNFLNDNIINPASEWLTGKEGETLGTAIYDFFNGTKDKIMTMTRDDLEEEKKKREDANWAQKKLGIGVMSEDEIAQAEERIRGEERLLAGAKRKKEAREAAENSSYKNVGEVDAVLADVDAKIAGLAQAIPALSAQGQHQIAARYGQELGALEAQKSELMKVKSGLELMGGSKEKSLTEQAKNIAVKGGSVVASAAQSIGDYIYDKATGTWKNLKDGYHYVKDEVTGMFKKAPDQTGFTSYNGGPISSGRPESIKDVLETGSSVSSGYSDFQRSQDEREVQEAIARQQQNIEYTKNREQIGQMRTGGFAAAQADYNRKMGISNNPETINRPSIDTSTVKPATPISIDPMVAEQAAMNRKMDRMIKQLEEANKTAPTSAPFDPYPDNKTILNASGGMF